MKTVKLIVNVLLIVILMSGFAFAQSKSYVKTFHISGNAEYLKSGTNLWKTLEAGKALYSGDSVRTHEDSFAEIAFDKKKENMVSILAKSHVVIRLKDEEKIELIDGEVFALVNQLPKGSTFEIRTPTAVCGARGTGWGAKANKAKTTVSAYEKDSYAKGMDESGKIMEGNLTVKQGYETIVKLFGKPSALSKISDKAYEKWNSWKDTLIDRIAGSRGKGMMGTNLEQLLSQKEKMVEKQDNDRVQDRLSRRAEEKREYESPTGGDNGGDYK